MKKVYSIIFAFLFFNLGAQAQFNVCSTGSYTRGEVYAHAVNDQIYWASRRNGTGTIVTTDGGNTWTLNSFTDPKGFPVYCIHAFDGNIAFVTASTIYKTTDRGTTWAPASGVFTNPASFPNTIHFFDQNNGVAMGDPVDGFFEIYTTSNAGINWVRVPSSNIPAPQTGEVGQVDLHAYYNDSYWFSTSKSRIFRSTDRGYTWTSYQFSQTDYLTAIAFRDELHGIADPLFDGPGWDYYSTSDGGNTWTFVSSSPSWINGYYNIVSIPGSQSIYTINSISYSGTERRAMVLFTNDDGMTWHRMDDWGTVSEVDWVDYGQWTSVNSGWGSFYNSNQGCIFHWPGYTGKHIWRAARNLKYSTILLGEVGDTIEISIGNYGTLPTTISSLNLSSANFSVVNPPSLPLTLQPWDAIEVSISITPQTRGLFNDSLIILSDAANYSSLSTYLKGKAIQFTPPLQNFIYAAAESLYTLTLTNLSPLLVGDLDGLQIQGLAIRPSDKILFGVLPETNSSTLYRIDPIVGGCLPLVTVQVGNIRSIAFSPSGTLFAGRKNGELYKINLSTGEATLIGSSSGKQYASFAFNPTDGKLYASVWPIIGSSKDAIYTIDTLTGSATLLGLTGDGKPTPSIAFNNDGKLYGLKGTGTEENKLIIISTSNGSGTEIGLLGKSRLQTITMLELVTGVEDENNGLLSSFELFQNYPNPFNPTTRISWQSPVNSHQTLKVYDVLGNEVATLVDECREAGKYEFILDASGLPSGIYFYKLQAGEFSAVRKMILMK